MVCKLRRTLTALLFLAALLVGMAYLALGTHPRQFLSELKATLFQEQVLSLSDRLGNATGLVEDTLTDTLDRDRLFIESYGLLQRLMGRRVMEDVDPQNTVVRLSNGALTFLNPEAVYSDPARQGQALSDFRDRLSQELGIPLLYVQAPQKFSAYGEARLPAGLTDYGDTYADDLLAGLAENGVDTLDLRPLFRDTGRYDSLFFRTDHHWTPEGAFTAWQAVAQTLEENYGLPLTANTADRSYWEVRTWEGEFLGSQGKRVGSLYAGTDSMELWSPKNGGQFQYVVPIMAFDRTGTMETSLLFPERLEESDPYQANPYTYYSGGDYSFARMKNLDNPEGPTVVLLRDSFGCAFAPFMAAGCGELVTIDLRYFQEDLMEYISWVEADLVVLLYSPGAIKLDSMFTFAPTA